MAIYVMPSGSAYFPPRKLLFVDDSIELSESDVNSAAGPHRLAELVFFSFSNLHNILKRAKIQLSSSQDHQNQENYVLNSRVISASIGRGGRHLELINPVSIVLRHLRTNYSGEPVCVFWNYESHGWSDQGCWIKESNLTHSVCQCNHLTHFAVVGKPMASDWIMTTLVPIVSVVSVIGIVIFVLIVVLIVKVIIIFYFKGSTGTSPCILSDRPYFCLTK